MQSVNKLLEINKLGALTNTNVQAWRALRFLLPNEKVLAKTLSDLTGDKVQSDIPEIDLVDEFILALLEDLREDPSYISTHTGALREMTIVYQNYINNVSNGTSKRTTKRGKQIVSTGVAEAIENGVKTKVILEHRTPVKTIRDRMITECFTLNEVREFMLNNVQLVWVTKAEDDRINAAGYKSSIPEDDDRYDIAGVELHNELVKFSETTLK